MNMTPLDLAILSLAIWFLAFTATQFSGPFNVFGWLRTKAHTEGAKAGSLGEMLGCIYCAVIYWALLVFLIWLTPARLAIYPFAMAGGALFIHRYSGGNHL